MRIILADPSRTPDRPLEGLKKPVIASKRSNVPSKAVLMLDCHTRFAGSQ